MVVGNWKMNGLRETLKEARHVNDAISASNQLSLVDVILCPPATLLISMSNELNLQVIRLGAQDCHTSLSGAYTGDISAEMLADAGASAVIIGHSERRGDHSETDKDVLSKQIAVHRAGLLSIVCIGETLGQRQADLTTMVVERQLEKSLGPQSTAQNTVVAYEPVWAIGSGVTPSLKEVSEIHSVIRGHLKLRFKEDGTKMRILYGGSVKPQNARDLMALENVNGALVGGASLNAADFLSIISASLN